MSPAELSCSQVVAVAIAVAIAVAVAVAKPWVKAHAAMQINSQQMSSENGGNEMAKANTTDRKTRMTRHTHKRMMKEKNKEK